MAATPVQGSDGGRGNTRRFTGSDSGDTGPAMARQPGEFGCTWIAERAAHRGVGRRSRSSGRKPLSSTTAGRADSPTIRELCVEAARACFDKGGEDTVILGVGASLGITDAFVITSATSSRQVRTITEAVELKVKAAGGVAPRYIEGLSDARWVLMDYGDFVVHAMLGEARDFYRLDGLWSDADAWEWAAPDPANSRVEL